MSTTEAPAARRVQVGDGAQGDGRAPPDRPLTPTLSRKGRGGEGWGGHDVWASPWLLAAPAIVLLVLFLGAPYADMVVMSLRTAGHGAPYGSGFTLHHYAEALGNPVYLGALGRSLLLGGIVTLGCLILSYPVALHLAKAGRSHLFFYAIVISPLLVGVLVRNFGWLIILSVSGPLNQLLRGLGLIDAPLRLLFSQGAVALGLIHVFVPFMVLPIAGALRKIPPDLAEASDALGAGRWFGFWHVTLPLSFPGIQAGTILVFVLSVSAYVTPALLGGQGRTFLSILTVQELLGSFAWPLGATLALVMAAAMGLVVLGFLAATRRLAERTAR